MLSRPFRLIWPTSAIRPSKSFRLIGRRRTRHRPAHGGRCKLLDRSRGAPAHLSRTSGVEADRLGAVDDPPSDGRRPTLPGPEIVGKHMLRIAPEQLDEFVAECDRRGSPGSPGTEEYWRDFEYQRRVAVDKGLDPFGDEYFKQQVALYNEISGRELNQNENEHTHFDLDAHIAAPNPYNHPEPTLLAAHLIRLSAWRRSGEGQSFWTWAVDGAFRQRSPPTSVSKFMRWTSTKGSSSL